MSVLKFYNTSTSQWESVSSGTDIGGGASSLGELTDVDLAATPPVADDVLIYDGTDWVPGTVSGGGGGASALNDLTDVNATPSTDDYLKYDGSEWVAAAGSGGGPSQSSTLDTPGSANALDDEFDDSVDMSGVTNGLDASWLTPGTAVVEDTDYWFTSLGGGGLYLNCGTSTAKKTFAKVAPAGDFVAKIGFKMKYYSNTRQMFALYNTNSSGNGVCVEYDTANSSALRLVSAYLQNAGNVDIASYYFLGNSGVLINMVLQKVGTTYYGGVSLGDDVEPDLKPLATITPSAFTSERVGFGRVFTTNSTSDMDVLVKYFRITE